MTAAAGAEGARQALARLTEASKRLGAMAAEAKQYAPGDPAPYGPAAAEAARRLAAAQEAYNEVSRRWQGLEYWTPEPPAGGARGGLFKLYDRWQAGREARSFLQALAGLEGRVAAAGEALRRVRQIPLEVAGRCGQARALGREIEGLAGALRAAGVQGDELDRAEAEARALREKLEAAPAYFLAGSAAQVARQATVEETVGVAQRLAEVEGPLSRLAASMQSWQGRLGAVREGLDALGRAVDRAGEGLAALPVEVEGQDLAAAVARMEDRARRLAAEATSAQVGRLADLAGEVSAATGETLQLAEEIEQVARLAGQLEGRVEGAGRLLGAVRLGMEEAAGARLYPLDWGPYLARWTRLEAVQDKLAGADKRRPARLRQDLQRVGELESRLSQLAGEVEEICRQREEIVRLLGGPALGPGATWPERARARAAAVGAYAAENWPDEWHVGRIGADAGALVRARRAKVPADGARPLPAAMVGDVAMALRRLEQEVLAFERRLAEVDRRLEALRQMEGEARRALAAGQEALEELGRALDRVRPAGRSKLGRTQRGLKKVRRQGERLGAAWGQPGQGSVEDKVQQQARWLRDAERAVQKLRGALEEEVGRVRAALQEEVAGLRAVARFDLEPAMGQAEQALVQPKQTGRLSLGRQRAQAPQGLQALAAAAGVLLAERERLAAARQRLRREIVEPLEGRRRAWQRARAEAGALAAQAAEVKRAAEGGWPPLAVDLQRAEDLLGRARRDEARLPGQGRSVGAAVDLLEEVVAGYERAAEMLARTLEEAEEMRGALARRAGEIERWRERLAAYRQGRVDDAAVVAAIDGRLAEIDREVRRLRQAWQGAPPSGREGQRALEGVVSMAGADLRARDGRSIRGRDVWRGR